jgi:hypothetical protein
MRCSAAARQFALEALAVARHRETEDPVDEDALDGFSTYYKDTIEVDKSSNYHTESIDNESYIRAKLVKERVYEVLKQNTTINFLNNRRKPSRSDFNTYYTILKSSLKTSVFLKS